MGRRYHGEPYLAAECQALGLQLESSPWCWRTVRGWRGPFKVRTVTPRRPHIGRLRKRELRHQRVPAFTRRTVHACHHH